MLRVSNTSTSLQAVKLPLEIKRKKLGRLFSSSIRICPVESKVAWYLRFFFWFDFLLFFFFFTFFACVFLCSNYWLVMSYRNCPCPKSRVTLGLLLWSYVDRWYNHLTCNQSVSLGFCYLIKNQSIPGHDFDWAWLSCSATKDLSGSLLSSSHPGSLGARLDLLISRFKSFWLMLFWN